MGDRRTSSTDRRLSHRGGRRLDDYNGRPLVLVVDDHVDSRDLLAAVLREIGVSLAEAGCGKDALARLRVPPMPRLVLLDLSLPDCHGTEIVRALKSDTRTTHIPVIALSANAIPRDIERGLHAGFFRYLTKPIKVAEFMDTLDVALKLAHTRTARVIREPKHAD